MGRDVLSQVIDTHFADFVDQVDSRGGTLPGYVQQAFWRTVGCGRPEGGFTLLRCDCGRVRVLPFSCKSRGFCPSCLGRRMNQLSANLVDHVLPEGVPLRQWVLSFPFPIRLWLLWKPDLRKAVLAVVLRVLFRWYARKAASAGVVGGRTGAVVAAQPFGSTLNANLHFHMLLLDGVFTLGPGDDRPTFHEVRPPSQEELTELVEQIRHRVERCLRRRGMLDDDPLSDPDDVQRQLQLAGASQTAAMGERAGRRARRVVGAPEQPRRKLPSKCAESGFFNLHAAVRVAGRDRGAKERLVRYVLRPPLALSRLAMREDGQLELRLKNAWRDGTTALVLSPFELLERLSALVPRPNERFLSAHGVLAPRAAWRAQIVPSRGADGPPRRPLRTERSGGAAPLPLLGGGWIPWRDLLARVFGVESLLCPCGQLMRVHAVVLGAAAPAAWQALQGSSWLIRGPP